MSRVKDLMIGSALGALATSAIVAFAGAQTMDPVKLSPQYYTVRIDNPQLRVYEYRLPPGQREVMHSHLPGVVIALSDATLKITLPDGSTNTHTAKTGDVAWRDSVTHALENTGSTDARAYAVELKGCTS
jgi:quercetin dioxygenase-like cupin family protein